MIAKIKRVLRQYPFLMNIAKKLNSILKGIKNKYSDKKEYKTNLQRVEAMDSSNENVWYFCVPVHNNLGDQAQAYCIRSWIKKHYPNSKVCELNSRAMYSYGEKLFKAISKVIKDEDLVVVQSGYTTTDIHGVDEYVHRGIMKHLKNNAVLIMPQTINFREDSQKKESADLYNAHKKLLFLARDEVSYDTAKGMFNSMDNVLLYPDIVTTKIGKFDFSYKRKDVLFCMRNDGETFYNDRDVKKTMKNVAEAMECRTHLSDTTVSSGLSIDEKYIDNTIEEFSKYKLIITDRYHGTIFALAAKTPVIVLKTNDHKVFTGANWFKDVYPNYITTAQNLEEVPQVAKDLLESERTGINNIYFEENYYDILFDRIEELRKG